MDVLLFVPCFFQTGKQQHCNTAALNNALCHRKGGGEKVIRD